MKNLILKYGLLVVFCLGAIATHAFTRVDSIGRRIEKGKIVVLHKVESGETVYSISRRYKTTEDAIFTANPASKAGLKVGQLIKVPTNMNADGNSTVVNEAGQKTHKVAKKETLYSISKMYNVGVKDLKKWNDLTSNDLDEGQTLVVSAAGDSESAMALAKNNTSPKEEADKKEVKTEETEQNGLIIKSTTTPSSSKSNTDSKDEKEEQAVAKTEEVVPEPAKEFPPGTKTHVVAKKETMYAISRKYDVSIDDIKRWNDLPTSALNEGQVIAVSGEPDPNAKKEELLAASEKPKEDEEFPYRTNNTSFKSSKAKSKTSTSNEDEEAGEKQSTANAEAERSSVKTSSGNSQESGTTKNNATSSSASKSNSSTSKSTTSRTTASKPAFNPESRFDGDRSFTSVGGGDERFHTVERGEGLYSISKKYGVSISDIKNWNNLPNDDIDYGQIILVSPPSANYKSALQDMLTVNYEEETGKSSPVRSSGNSGNTVRKYNPETGKVEEVYSESTDPYHINKSRGQDHAASTIYGTVTYGEPQEVEEEMTPEEKVKVQEALKKSQIKLTEHEAKKEEFKRFEEERVEKQQKVAAKPAGNSELNLFLNIPNFADTWEDSVRLGIRGIKKNVGQFGKIMESGICEVIEDNHWDSKYNCLHHDAEIGTIILVRNPETKHSVFVRVVGRMNEDSKKPHRIIKISHHAVERLGSKTARFAVEISYVDMNNRKPGLDEF